LLIPATAQALPGGFFGIAPQTTLTEVDAQYMSAGGVESIRMEMPWASVQPTSAPIYDWSSLDPTVAIAARHHLQVLPFFYGTPPWLSNSLASLPIDTMQQREAWAAFVTAAVDRYGPTGTFWEEHGPFSSQPVPFQPIRTWQVWNEANFFYFTFPVSPTRYAELLKLTYPAIKAADPEAKVILSGLFGKPDEGGSRGMPASRFLAALYRVPGIRADFDGVALHPYAISAANLEEIIEATHRVMLANHDSVPLYITEMGWGSQNDFRKVAFEQGVRGQARVLREVYGYLIANQSRLRLRGAFWFSWKDLAGSCSFCDSVGLFKVGASFRLKPAWRSFTALTGGKVRP
jgi:hypothetical protein